MSFFSITIEYYNITNIINRDKNSLFEQIEIVFYKSLSQIDRVRFADLVTI